MKSILTVLGVLLAILAILICVGYLVEHGIPSLSEIFGAVRNSLKYSKTAIGFLGSKANEFVAEYKGTPIGATT